MVSLSFLERNFCPQPDENGRYHPNLPVGDHPLEIEHVDNPSPVIGVTSVVTTMQIVSRSVSWLFSNLNTLPTLAESCQWQKQLFWTSGGGDITHDCPFDFDSPGSLKMGFSIR